MQRIFRERDRLLRRASRLGGLAGTATVLPQLLVPGGVNAAVQPVTLLLLAAMATSIYFLGRSGRIIWAASAVLAGNAIVLLVGLAPAAGVGLNVVEETVIAITAGGSLPAVAIVMAATRRRLAVLTLLFLLTMSSLLIITMSSSGTLFPLTLTVCAWIASTVGGWWLGRSVPRVMMRIAALGRAHEAERQASEQEARRRQDARLLHDTVLATLTLLAHAGVGVEPAALRQQAGDDARLLRRLRLGELPTPTISGTYSLKTATGLELDTVLETVTAKYSRLGLNVSWHGIGHVRLSYAALDTLLLALGECLENVRRHSGVDQADVTISEDDLTVRAMVTDAGVGFDPASIGSGHLGFTESVVARLQDAGGNARLFSSPGSGTTVVLEVPK
jgi:signal transduction histidine kinase